MKKENRIRFKFPFRVFTGFYRNAKVQTPGIHAVPLGFFPANKNHIRSLQTFLHPAGGALQFCSNGNANGNFPFRPENIGPGRFQLVVMLSAFGIPQLPVLAFQEKHIVYSLVGHFRFFH